MSRPLIKPPALSDEDVAKAVEVLHFVEADETLPENLRSALYYPLQSVALPRFYKEVLEWSKDTLQLFEGNKVDEPLEFVRPEHIETAPSLPKVSPLPRYKRKDDFTVLAILPLGQETCIVFTNEVAQHSWEIIGIFGLRFRNKLLANTPGLVEDYAEVDASYEPSRQAKTEEDHYWNRYAADEHTTEEESRMPHEVIRSEKQLLRRSNDEVDVVDDESSYWDRLANQPHQITNGETGEVAVRNDVVKLLVNLAELYIDLGVPNKTLIIDDIMSISLGSKRPMQIGVPLVAHRHAIRTIRWLTKDGSDISQETAVALRKIERY